MCSSRNIHTFPVEGIFSRTPPPPPHPPLKILISLLHFFTFFGLTETPSLQENSIPSAVEVYWVFAEKKWSNVYIQLSRKECSESDLPSLKDQLVTLTHI